MLKPITTISALKRKMKPMRLSSGRLEVKIKTTAPELFWCNFFVLSLHKLTAAGRFVILAKKENKKLKTFYAPILDKSKLLWYNIDTERGKTITTN